MVTERDVQILLLLATYYTLTRAQIGRVLFPRDADGRETRRHLNKLLNLKFVHRARMEVANPAYGIPAPVHYLAHDGAAFLAQHFEDEKYLACCTQTPNWQHLYHWTAVAEFHMVLDRAAAKAGIVQVAAWYGEWDVINAEAEAPEQRYRLYTRLGPKLVCIPDAGFSLKRGDARRAFYLELDRHTTMNADRVAAQKCGGYAALIAQRLQSPQGPGHLRHFPDSNPERFTVLMTAPSAKRRDALRRAVGRKPGSDLWRFASQTDLTDDTLLTAPVWYPCAGEPGPIVKAAANDRGSSGCPPGPTVGRGVEPCADVQGGERLTGCQGLTPLRSVTPGPLCFERDAGR